ncbi:MAG: heparinase, partial [Flavisolibacter sp.]|nr:heparinase [Flavisolibacter sp.]
AELIQGGKKLTLQVQAPANVTMKTWSTDPPNSYDAPNPGTALVGFEVKLPANSKTALTVELIPEKALSKATKQIQPLQNWNRK